MKLRIVRAFAIVVPLLGALPASAHPAQPSIDHFRGAGAILCSLDIFDEAGQNVGSVLIAAQTDGLAVSVSSTPHAQATGSWFEAPFSLDRFDVYRGKPSKILVDPGHGAKLELVLDGAELQIDLRVTDPTAWEVSGAYYIITTEGHSWSASYELSGARHASGSTTLNGATVVTRQDNCMLARLLSIRSTTDGGLGPPSKRLSASSKSSDTPLSPLNSSTHLSFIKFVGDVPGVHDGQALESELRHRDPHRMRHRPSDIHVSSPPSSL